MLFNMSVGTATIDFRAFKNYIFKFDFESYIREKPAEKTLFLLKYCFRKCLQYKDYRFFVSLK